MKLRFPFLLGVAMLFLVLAKAEAQQPSMPVSALFDSLATAPVIHQGPIGFGGSITQRGLWLDNLTARRGEWFHMDSLDSHRPTTRAVTILNLDKRNEEQLFSAYAKTIGDTARITFGRGCVFTEGVIGGMARGQIINAFTIRTGLEQKVDKRIVHRLDSMLLSTDNIAGRGALDRLLELYEIDTLGSVQHFRRIYQRNDEATALGCLLQYRNPKDSTLLIERLLRSNKQAVTEALELYDARYASHLNVVVPMMTQLVPESTNYGSERFYRALMKALLKTPQVEGEEILGRLEAVLSKEQRTYNSWIDHVRAGWEE